MKRIVTDLNMIKNMFAACSRKLGFELVEPHKKEEESSQEQRSPNIPEEVYSISDQYRHLLNTFIGFSRDLVVHVTGEEDTRFYKVENQNNNINKQAMMSYKLQITDLKEKYKSLEKQHKLLQDIYQNHCDSRLQIIDFNDYDSKEMSEFTQECVTKIKSLHKDLMELQTLFLKNIDNMEGLNYDCETYVRENDRNLGDVTYNNIEFDTSCPQERFDKLKRNTFNLKSRNDIDHHEFGIRRSQEVNP